MRIMRTVSFAFRSWGLALGAAKLRTHPMWKVRMPHARLRLRVFDSFVGKSAISCWRANGGVGAQRTAMPTSRSHRGLPDVEIVLLRVSPPLDLEAVARGGATDRCFQTSHALVGVRLHAQDHLVEPMIIQSIQSVRRAAAGDIEHRASRE